MIFSKIQPNNCSSIYIQKILIKDYISLINVLEYNRIRNQYYAIKFWLAWIAYYNHAS